VAEVEKKKPLTEEPAPLPPSNPLRKENRTAGTIRFV